MLLLAVALLGIPIAELSTAEAEAGLNEIDSGLEDSAGQDGNAMAHKKSGGSTNPPLS